MMFIVIHISPHILLMVKLFLHFQDKVDKLFFEGENNMDYKFELLSTGSLVIRLQKEFDILEAFLNVEVSQFGDWIAETVDKVLSEKVIMKNKCEYFRSRCSKKIKLLYLISMMKMKSKSLLK